MLLCTYLVVFAAGSAFAGPLPQGGDDLTDADSSIYGAVEYTADPDNLAFSQVESTTDIYPVSSGLPQNTAIASSDSDSECMSDASTDFFDDNVQASNKLFRRGAACQVQDSGLGITPDEKPKEKPILKKNRPPQPKECKEHLGKQILVTCGGPEVFSPATPWELLLVANCVTGKSIN